VSIDSILSKRGIKEILHFTTNQGLTGILASKAVKPRKRLPQDKLLEHICIYNCPDRSRDMEWHDYVNLSITSVNLRLLGISRDKWHPGPDIWWCILCFSPTILAHPGVYFTTTNNAYPGVRRAQGAQGLENMFADRIVWWRGHVVERRPSTPANQPTYYQAEVLYPGELSVEHLEHVYVDNEDDASSVESMLDVFAGVPNLDCILRPEFFD